MSNVVGVNTVRKGVSLLSGLLKEMDAQGNGNGRVSKTEVKNFLYNYGDGGTMDEAVEAIHRFAQNRSGTVSVPTKEMNKALGQAMRSIAKADSNKSGIL